jgi:hypothetical protein
MAESNKITESNDFPALPLDESTVIFAKNPEEMQASQERLAAWFQGRVALAKQELTEAEENLEQAKKRKWATRGWSRQASLARGRVNFYEKCEAALKEGYCIIPDFPTQVFAVRTSRKKPMKNTRTRLDWTPDLPDQRSDGSPVGEGEYKSADANEHETHRQVEDAKGDKRTQVTTWAGSFRPPDFPMKRVKTQILDATGKAMAKKIFDEIGVLPARRSQHRARDPIVTGRIVRREGPFTEIALTFLISWWIDVRDL